MPLTAVVRRRRLKNPEKDQAVHKRYYQRHKEQTFARVYRFRLYKAECRRLINIQIE